MCLILTSSNFNKWLVQFMKFGFVGLINTFLTLGIIFFSTSILHFAYITANVLGFCVGFVSSFILNRLWTFDIRGSVIHQALLFMFVFVISYFIQLMVLLILNDALSVPIIVAQIIAMGFYTIVNFTGNKLITFRKRI
jgi:putative flippase GtrA